VSADAGHEQVEQHTVDRLNREQLKRLLARARQRDLVALCAQRLGELLEIRLTVVDGENLLRSQQAGGAARSDLRAGAAQHRAQPRQDDRHGLALAREGIGAGIERANLGGAIFRASQKQTGHAAQGCIETDAPDHGCTIDARQHAVDDDGQAVPQRVQFWVPTGYQASLKNRGNIGTNTVRGPHSLNADEQTNRPVEQD